MQRPEDVHIRVEGWLFDRDAHVRLGREVEANLWLGHVENATRVAPNVLVNQDTAAAPQNETAIAVDPNNPSRIVGGANDYVTRTWPCTVDGTPCSALGDGYSGTYFSNLPCAASRT